MFIFFVYSTIRVLAPNYSNLWGLTDSKTDRNDRLKGTERMVKNRRRNRIPVLYGGTGGFGFADDKKAEKDENLPLSPIFHSIHPSFLSSSYLSNLDFLVDFTQTCPVLCRPSKDVPPRVVVYCS